MQKLNTAEKIGYVVISIGLVSGFVCSLFLMLNMVLLAFKREYLGNSFVHTILFIVSLTIVSVFFTYIALIKNK